MPRLIRQDFQAVNSRGIVLFTFNDAAKGRAWVRENAALHDGLVLEQIEIVARRVYRPRGVAARPDPFSIPAFA